MIREHRVVAHRHAHEIIAAGGGEHDRQVLDGVLVGAGVIGVAGIAAHRDAGQLAHEVIFEPGALDLARIVQIFRTDEANDRVDLIRDRSVSPGRNCVLRA